MPSTSQLTAHEDRSVSPEVTLSVTTSPSKLIKVARDLEIDRNAAQAEIRELRRKLADIGNQSDTDDETPAKKVRSDSERIDADRIREDQEQVAQAGHLYAIMYGLWLHLADSTFKTKYVQDFSEAERFDNIDNKVQGEIHEIMEILGPRLSQEISEPWVIKAFTSAMRTQRSNTATRLRHHCAALFDVSDNDMLRAETRKVKFRSRIGWVEVDGGGSYSSADVEILHKDFKGTYDINTVFLNPILMRVFCAIIRGPLSARGMIHGAIASNPKNDTMARKHRIRNITPGAIAATAVFARWALSSDDSFQSVGQNTGIPYAQDFDEYLGFLMSGLRRKKRSVLNIIREWDRIVFPNSESSLVDRDASSSGFKIAMQMLDDDETEDNATSVLDESNGDSNAED